MNISLTILVAFALGKKSLYLELLWSAFSRIRIEYGEIRSISPYSVQLRENADENSSEYVHILRCVESREYQKDLSSFF